MLSFVYKSVNNLFTPSLSSPEGMTTFYIYLVYSFYIEEEREAEARSKEDEHAKQFDQQAMLQRAMKV